MNALSEYHPLDQVLIRLETAVSETPEGLAETHRMLADYLGLPGLDFSQGEVVRTLVPPGWEPDFWEMGEGWSCFMRSGEEMTRGCGATQEEALLFATVWAILKEEERGHRWRPAFPAVA
jgi:hypothetical protein